MHDVYQEAAAGNLAFIQEWLLKHPDLINERFKGYAPPSTVTVTRTLGGYGLLATTGLVAAGPIAPALALAGLATCAGLLDIYSWKTKKQKHLGWTLLEFAAEKGAVSVATLLICEGADTHEGRFLKIAEQNGHKAFVETCRSVKQQRANYLNAKNQLERAINEKNSALESVKKLKQSPANNIDQDKRLIQLFDALNEVDRRDQEIERLQKIITEMQGAKTKEKTAPFGHQANHQSGQQSRAAFFHHQFPYGLSDKNINYIPGDCFLYAAIANASQNNRSPWTPRELREAIYRELMSKPTEYQPSCVPEGNTLLRTVLMENRGEAIGFFTKETRCSNYQAYCEHVRQDGSWIDSLEIRAFCNAMKVCCIVARKGENTPVAFGREHASNKTPPIIVGYINENHYVALQCPQSLSPMDILNKIETADPILNNPLV